MNNSEWLASIKPGDEVAIRHSFGGNHDIGKVVRRDKVKIIVSGEKTDETFSAKHGRTLGVDSLSARELCEVTEVIRISVHRRRLVRRVENMTQWDKLPTTLLESIVAILNGWRP